MDEATNATFVLRMLRGSGGLMRGGGGDGRVRLARAEPTQARQAQATRVRRTRVLAGLRAAGAERLGFGGWAIDQRRRRVLVEDKDNFTGLWQKGRVSYGWGQKQCTDTPAPL